MMSSFNPGGASSASISVVNPYWYSSWVTFSIGCSCTLGFMFSSRFRGFDNPLDCRGENGRCFLADPFFHLRLRRDQVGKLAFFQVTRHGVGKARPKGPDGAIHRVDAGLMFPRGGRTIFLAGKKLPAQGLQNLVHVDLLG